VSGYWVISEIHFDIECIGIYLIQAPKLERRIMPYELTDYEWAAVRSFLPNKPRGVPRVSLHRGQ